MYSKAAGLVLVFALLVVFSGDRLSEAQVRQVGGYARVGDPPSITVVVHADNPRAAMEASLERADDYAQAMGSSWGRLLRQLQRVEEVRVGDRIEVRVTFEMTGGITPETFLPKEK